MYLTQGDHILAVLGIEDLTHGIAAILCAASAKECQETAHDLNSHRSKRQWELLHGNDQNQPQQAEYCRHPKARFMMQEPAKPPKIALKSNADSKIIPNIAGMFLMLMISTMIATAT